MKKEVRGNQDFLSGGGEMERLIRAKDWRNTPLGPMETWPRSLKTSVGMILPSPMPLVMLWGSEGIMIYNDAYSLFAGERHPSLLGSRVLEGWPEITDFNRNVMDKGLKGEALSYKDHTLVLYRNNVPEEVILDLNCSPLVGESGHPEGVLAIISETTGRTIGERQLASLRELALQTAEARTVSDVCKRTLKALEVNKKDIPFSLLYLVDDQKDGATLVETGGLNGNPQNVPDFIDLREGSTCLMPGFIQGKEFCFIDDLHRYFNELPTGEFNESPRQAVALPISQPGAVTATAILIVGINPYRPYNKSYERYHNLIAGQIDSSIANAQAYEDERKKSKSLAEIDVDKTLFFSNVSHEFRTPLTLMLDPVQELLHEEEDSDKRERLQVVHRNALRLQKLVNTLLDFSSIEAGRVQASYVPINIASYTAELTSNFQSAIENAGMKLIVKMPKLSEDVFVDRDMWEKIVLNLLSNAFKFTLEGEIEVEMNEYTDHVTLKIRDTGEGIPEADLTNIFERFSRIEKVKSRSHDGSGIGLSLVKELVKLHGGDIDVKSELGKGTTFSVNIPKGSDHLPKDNVQLKPESPYNTTGVMAYIEEARQWLPSNEPETHSGAAAELRPFPGFNDKPKVVVADDNADMRNHIQRLLAPRFDVTVTANGREALEAIKRQIPHLVLSDVMMPEMNGFELAKALKSDPKTAQVPIVMLSAKVGEKATIEGIEAGVDDYLEKPFNSNELVARLSTIIVSNQMRHEAENRLHAFFMEAPALIAFLKSPEHVVEMANIMFMELVGKDREVIGKTLIEALPELKDQGFIELLNDAYKTGRPYFGNEILTHLDRDYDGVLEDVYLNFVFQPYRDARGDVQGIFIHGVDVTEQVKIRQAILESEEKYKTLFERMDQGFGIMRIIFDDAENSLDFEFLEVNPSFEKLLGLMNPIGKKASEIAPNLEKRWFEIYGKVAKTGEAIRFAEYSEVMGRWFDVYAFRVGAPEDSTVAALFTDITEGKKTQESLMQSEKLMRMINDSVPAFISYVNNKERFVFVNRAYEEYFGQSKEELTSKTVREVLGPESYPRSEFAIKKALEGESIRFENAIIKNNERKHLDVEYISDIAEDGRVKGFVVIGHDITERKRSEEAIRRISDQLTAIFHNAPGGLMLFDNKANILFANEVAANYLDYKSVDELLSKTDLSNLQKEFTKKFTVLNEKGEAFDLKDTTVSKALRGEKGSQEIAQYFNKRTHEDIWALSRANPIKDENGDVELVLVSITDITEQKRAEQSLRKSKEYYQAMTDNTPVMAWVAGTDGQVTYLNKQWCIYSGQTWKDGLGNGWLDVVHVDDLKLAKNLFYEANIKQEPFSFECRIRDKNGNYRWFMDSGLPKFDENGIFEGFVGAVIDIHERKIAEEKLKESEEFSRTLLESSPDSVKALNLKGRILSANSQGLKQFALDNLNETQEVIWRDFWKGDYYDVAVAAFDQAKHGQIGHFQGAKPTPTGILKWWDVMLAPVYGRNRRVERIVSVSRDITEFKMLEQQKDDFIGIASHELKTPVTSIKAYTQVLQSRFSKAEDIQSSVMLTKMDTQINKLTGLITDLLDVTKIAQGQLIFKHENFDINLLVNEIVEEIQRTTDKQKIVTQLSQDQFVNGDRERIGQVIINFLTNAIKYSPDHREIVISTSISDHELTLSVKDEGVGLSGEDHEKVFERFYRAGGADNITYPGLGLGLYISAQIIDRHNGRTWVESVEGKGSTFYFSLPLKEN